MTAAGHFVEQPVKRAYDTGLIIYELVHGGPESERGRAMVRLMNRAHHGRGIDQEDLTYVLYAMIVAPFRYIKHAGWRPLTALELRSGVEYWRDIGRRMAIDRLPGPGRPIAQLVFVSQLRDPRVITALGLEPAPRPVQRVADAAARIHGLRQRQHPPRTESIFTPGRKAGSIYPHGYHFDELGPH